MLKSTKHSSMKNTMLAFVKSSVPKIIFKCRKNITESLNRLFIRCRTGCLKFNVKNEISDRQRDSKTKIRNEHRVKNVSFGVQTSSNGLFWYQSLSKGTTRSIQTIRVLGAPHYCE